MGEMPGRQMVVLQKSGEKYLHVRKKLRLTKKSGSFLGMFTF